MAGRSWSKLAKTTGKAQTVIEDPPVLTIRRRFERPAADAVAALRDVPTGQLVDAMGGRAALDYRIKPVLDPEKVPCRFAGVAVTCHAGPADNLALWGALDLARSGDVIVAATDAFTGTAVIGDLMAGMMRNRGVAAVVTDGLARDLAGLTAAGLPVYCRGLSPDSPARNGPGTVGMTVTVGGATIDSGDIVAGDEDGVVVVPHARIAETIAALADVRAAEAELERSVQQGLEMPDFARTILASNRVKVVD